MCSPLSWGDHVQLVLDRSGADQCLPVVLAGHEGECGRQQDGLRTLKRQDAKELRKAQVVADSESDRDAVDLSDGGDLSSRCYSGRLLEPSDAVEHDVIHVDLAVAGDDVTRGIDDDGSVVHPRVARPHLVDAAPVNVDTVLPRALCQQFGDRSRYRFRLVATHVVWAEIRPNLGQRY